VIRGWLHTYARVQWSPTGNTGNTGNTGIREIREIREIRGIREYGNREYGKYGLLFSFVFVLYVEWFCAHVCVEGEGLTCRTHSLQTLSGSWKYCEILWFCAHVCVQAGGLNMMAPLTADPLYIHIEKESDIVVTA
jgi:hypothetical protein